MHTLAIAAITITCVIVLALAGYAIAVWLLAKRGQGLD